MFGKLKELATKSVNRLSGRTDLLEAIAASCALVAAADGDIEDEEVITTINALVSHPVLSASFSQTQIEANIDTMIKRAKGGISGRLGLYREIEEAKARSTSDDLEMLFVIAIDVAMSDGEYEPEERKVLEKIGKALGLNANSYLDA